MIAPDEAGSNDGDSIVIRGSLTAREWRQLYRWMMLNHSATASRFFVFYFVVVGMLLVPLYVSITSVGFARLSAFSIDCAVAAVAIAIWLARIWRRWTVVLPRRVSIEFETAPPTYRFSKKSVMWETDFERIEYAWNGFLGRVELSFAHVLVSRRKTVIAIAKRDVAGADVERFTHLISQIDVRPTLL